MEVESVALKLNKRPDGRYAASVKIEGTNKRKYFYGKTQREVKQKMLEYQIKQEQGLTVVEVSELWQDKHWQEIRPGTQVCYSPALRRVQELFPRDFVKDVTPLDVKRTVDIVASQGLGKKSVETYLSVCSQIFDFAILMGQIKANPCAAVKVPKGLKQAKRKVPPEEYLDAIRNSIDEPFGLFAYMLLYTGLRRGELLALQWKAIDIEKRTISVYQKVDYAATGNQPEISDPKTEAGFRVVTLLDRLVPYLEKRRGKPEEYVFGGKRPLTMHQFQDRWRNYCIATGMYTEHKVPKMRRGKATTATVKKPAMTPHQLRHAYATLLYEADVSPKDAQKLLGHSRIDVTMDIYTEIREGRLSDISDKLNNLG